MRVRNLFYLLLALPLVFAACTETPDEPNVPVVKEPVLTLTSEATMEFTADGGAGEITYTLENEKEDVTLSAECTADWVTDLTAGDKVTFTVAANDVEEARETKITVKYDTKSFEVAVKQAAKNAEPVPPVTEYDVEVEMAASMRLDTAEFGLSDNCFLLAFVDETQNWELLALLIGGADDEVLQAGTYSTANGSMDTNYIIAGTISPEVMYEFKSATVDVAVDGNVYELDMVLTGTDDKLFHFTYSGEIIDMVPAGPTGPVTWEAPRLDAEYYGDEFTPGVGNYYLILTDNGLDADGYLQYDSTYYILDVYGPMVSSKDEYVPVPVGTYTLDVTDSGAEWSIGNYYSNYYKTDSTHVVAQELYDSATLVVTETGMTLTAVIDGYEHTVTYNGAPLAVNFAPAMDDVELKVDYAYAVYYGDQYTPDSADNFYFFLSDVGVDADGYEYPNGKYYRLDIYTEILDTTNGVAMPYGTYVMDPTDSCEPGTISAYYSAYYVLDEYGYDFVDIKQPTDATVTVDENGVVAEVYFGSTLHRVTFEGVVEIFDQSSGDDGGSGGGGDDPFEGGGESTLEGDLALNITDANYILEYYGDYYYTGADNWVLYLYEDGITFDGAYIMLDFMSDPWADDISGTYTCDDSYLMNTYLAGTSDGYGCWYIDMENGEPTGVHAAIMDGTITIDRASTGAYTITLDCVDVLGNAITGTIVAYPFPEEMSTSSSKTKRALSVAQTEVKRLNVEKVCVEANRNVEAVKGVKIR